MDKVNIFIPIQKVNAERREVWGWGAIEEPDNSDEIMDYNSSKPHFTAWSQRAEKRSGGKSLGNVRAMHQNISAGKLISLRADDASKGFYVGAKIVDDNEWRKVEQGVYTGFSIGGSYLKRWPDFTNPGKIRYTAKPNELSIVDSPCIDSATFQMIKMDGAVEEVPFQPGDGENEMDIETEEDEDIEGDDTAGAEIPPDEEELEKGGPGSGIKGHTPENDAQAQGGDYVDYKAERAAQSRAQAAEQADDVAFHRAHDKQVSPPRTGEHFYDWQARIKAPAQVSRREQVAQDKESDWQINDDVEKLTVGEVMNKLESIYLALDEIERGLLKVDAPGAPEPIADIPLTSQVGPSFVTEQMPPPNVLMEIKPNAEPSQEALAEHAVKSQDLTSQFNAWLPKVGALVKSMVAEALAESTIGLGKTTRSAPAQIIKVTRNRMITVRKEKV